MRVRQRPVYAKAGRRRSPVHLSACLRAAPVPLPKALPDTIHPILLPETFFRNDIRSFNFSLFKGGNIIFCSRSVKEEPVSTDPKHVIHTLQEDTVWD